MKASEIKIGANFSCEMYDGRVCYGNIVKKTPSGYRAWDNTDQCDWACSWEFLINDCKTVYSFQDYAELIK